MGQPSLLAADRHLPTHHTRRRCKAEELVFIGDRYLTDVVFGNRNGMLTIRPAPFTSKGEPKAVLLVSAWGEGVEGGMGTRLLSKGEPKVCAASKGMGDDRVGWVDGRATVQRGLRMDLRMR